MTMMIFKRELFADIIFLQILSRFCGDLKQYYHTRLYRWC